jgi:hypothetical protein
MFSPEPSRPTWYGVWGLAHLKHIVHAWLLDIYADHQALLVDNMLIVTCGREVLEISSASVEVEDLEGELRK